VGKKVTKKICKTCGEDKVSNGDRGVYMFKDTYHQLKTKEYCKEHERVYTGHKCVPFWCGDCGFLIKYEIEIGNEKKNKVK